jgi:hypothetical protein
MARFLVVPLAELMTREVVRGLLDGRDAAVSGDSGSQIFENAMDLTGNVLKNAGDRFIARCQRRLAGWREEERRPGSADVRPRLRAAIAAAERVIQFGRTLARQALKTSSAGGGEARRPSADGSSGSSSASLVSPGITRRAGRIREAPGRLAVGHSVREQTGGRK